jgi:hypothetical protein
VAAHGHVVVLEAEPQRPVRPAVGERGDEVLRSLLAVEALDLLGGLADVAEVGDEAAHVAPDHGHAVRAGEAGDVAQVGAVGDQQQVDVARLERRGGAIGAAHSASLRPASASR